VVYKTFPPVNCVKSKYSASSINTAGEELVLALTTDHVTLAINYSNPGELESALKHSFPRRYLPDYRIELSSPAAYNALIEWIPGNESFKVLKVQLGESSDTYVIKAGLPQPYVNESPVFFLLQVIARACTRRGYLVFTDSVAVYVNGRVYLLVGYPHTGKSTLASLTLALGGIPLSTENTVLELSETGALRVAGGSPILVYDPRIEDLYGVRLSFDEETRHGYRVVDLNKHAPERVEIISRKPSVDYIILLHCAFNTAGVSLEPVKGRKIKKTLWHFATALLSGDDYYEPYPLSLLDEKTAYAVSSALSRISEYYEKRVYEVFGKHDRVFEAILSLP